MYMDIVPKQIDRIGTSNNGAFCFDDCIATYAGYIGRSYEMMYGNCWSFSLIPGRMNDTTSLVEIMNTDRNESYRLLEKLHGIKLKREKLLESSKAKSYILEELEAGRPTVFITDAFWCPWDPVFQKYHNIHAFLIVGFDETNNSFICVDSYFLKCNSVLPMECFINGYKGIYSFEALPEPVVINYEEVIRDHAKSLLSGCSGENHFELMRSFGSELMNIDIKRQLEDSGEFWLCPIFQVFNYIISTRVLYANALKYIADKSNIKYVAEILESFLLVIEKWNVAKGMLIKSFSLNNTHTEVVRKLSDTIIELAKEEEGLALDITKANIDQLNIKASIKDNKVSRQDIINYSCNDYVFIDLSGYLNNKGFDTYPPKSPMSDFTSYGHYFIREEDFIRDTWNVGDMLFKVHIDPNETYDNVSCMGQEISVPEGYYGRIRIMGCSEYGSYTDKVGIYTTGGNVYSIPITFYEWCDNSNKDILAWKGRIAHKKENEVLIIDQEHKIYAKEFVLSYNEKINKIKLPECPNLHLFAISMLKS